MKIPASKLSSFLLAVVLVLAVATTAQASTKSAYKNHKGGNPHTSRRLKSSKKTPVPTASPSSPPSSMPTTSKKEKADKTSYPSAAPSSAPSSSPTMKKSGKKSKKNTTSFPSMIPSSSPSKTSPSPTAISPSPSESSPRPSVAPVPATPLAWTRVGNDIDGESDGDLSGSAVALSADGSIIAIGAVDNAGVNGVDSGHVRIYQWDGSSWSQLGTDIDGEVLNDHSGRSVALSSDGTTVAIGAWENNGNGDKSGHVRVYKWLCSQWIQLGVDIDGENADDRSGVSVSLSANGSVVAIGASLNDNDNGTDSGHVRIFRWDGSAWHQAGNDIDGRSANARFGGDLSLSDGGLRIAIGGTYSSGQPGYAAVYEWNDGMSDWIQLGVDLEGDSNNDYFGRSVSLSSNGQRIAVAGPFHDDATVGAYAGHVRVFEPKRVS